jgi:hypothetical protein
MLRLTTYCVLLLALALGAPGELHPPAAQVTAGNGFSISTTGNGDATFYLIGPSHVAKRQVKLGQDIAVDPTEVKKSGRYLAIACGSGGCSSASFYVMAAEPDKVSFLLHPSRVPVKANDAINATAFVFDKFHNPVLTPVTVNFKVMPKTSPSFTRSVKATHGVAWMRMASTPKEGPVKVIAEVAKASELRIIQQVASDACNLRIKATRTAKGVLVETDPVRDCSGNAVPDGTIVSFTEIDAQGKTTVDAPIKKGIARTELPVSGSARISVASGVVMGNEISLGGGL